MNTIYLVGYCQSLDDLLDGFATSIAGLKKIILNRWGCSEDEIEITIDFPNKTILAVNDDYLRRYHIHVVRRAT
jgi:hypothetical protein